MIEQDDAAEIATAINAVIGAMFVALYATNKSVAFTMLDFTRNSLAALPPGPMADEMAKGMAAHFAVAEHLPRS